MSGPRIEFIGEIDRFPIARIAALGVFGLEQELGEAAAGVLVVVNLVSEAELAHLHALYFNDPSPTDIITFPIDDELEDGGRHLGDLAISVDAVAFQAASVGQAPARELGFLTLHGLLHLTGYDDKEPCQRATMIDRQLELLEAWERMNGALT